MKQLIPLCLCTLLSSCIDPYMMDMGRDPYADPYGGQRRAEVRENGRELNQMAYERGTQDGQYDAQRRQSQNYNRYRSKRFDPNTELAYRDGYNDSYEQTVSGLNNLNRPPADPYGGYTPPLPGGSYGQPTPYNQPAPQPRIEERDAAYQQGYDYGLRDRTGGRVADPAVHVGRYDPRKRSSFERGYYDGYNTRSGSTSSSGSPSRYGSGGTLWSL